MPKYNALLQLTRDNNTIVADQLQRIATLLQYEDKEGYRSGAFAKAAKVIRSLPKDIKSVDYKKLPNIGKSTSACITEILALGSSMRLAELEQKYPDDIMTFTQIDGITPTKAFALAAKYGVKDLMALYTAIKAGTVKKISKSLTARVIFAVEEKQRKPLYLVLNDLQQLRQHIHADPDVSTTLWVGSVRRLRSSIKNADLLVVVPDDTTRENILERIKALVVQAGGKLLPCGLFGAAPKDLSFEWPTTCGRMPIEIILTKPECAGAAAFYYTGSKAHNTAIALRAREQSLRIDETGIWNGTQRIGGDQEEDVYTSLNLPFWFPFYREGADLDIVPPSEHEMPTQEHLKRVLHICSNWTHSSYPTMKEIADAAESLGYLELIFTERTSAASSKFLGRDPHTLATYQAACNVLNDWYDGMTIRAGFEVGIEPDGTLDYPQPLLLQVDWVVAKIYKNPQENVEQRLLTAIQNPAVKMLSHVSGRILGKQAASENVNWKKVFQAAAERNVLIEIDGDPETMDPPRELILLAKRCGCKFAINDLALEEDGRHFYRRVNGLQQARRAWLVQEDIA